MNLKKHILIIDDEQGIRLSLQGILQDEDYSVILAENGSQALEIISKNEIQLIILDIWLDNSSEKQKTTENDGITLLEHIKSLPKYNDIPIIMISGHSTIEIAVNALKLGAYDFIEKPLSLDTVLNTVSRALEVENLKSENKALKSELATKQVQHDFVGNSPSMEAFKSALEAVAPTDVWVLITGENGTGKELAARSVHKASLRADKPFIAVNCAAIPDELIESELFGHEKGSFTGAERRIGRFELANNGTLFLDEIGDMNLKTQAKILRILQEQSFERVGGTKTIHVNVRVLAATNKDLEKAMNEETFRSDLYYRLRGFPLHLPPLRERASDIPQLIATLSQTMQQELSLTAPQFSQESLTLLQKAPWKGNIRELKHTLEQLAILYPNTIITPNMLCALIPSSEILAEIPNSSSINTCEKEENQTIFDTFLQYDYKTAKAEFEIWYLEQKLAQVANNMTKLSELVGLDRSYLHRKLKTK